MKEVEIRWEKKEANLLKKTWSSLSVISQLQMEEISHFNMEKTRKIIRRSIYTFLQNYQYFTSTSVLLVLPFSASILFSRALFSSSLESLFNTAGFSQSIPHVLASLNINLSEMIFSSVLSLPFMLTSLIIAKALTIQALTHHEQTLSPPFSSFISLYIRLLHTHLCNLVLIVSLNTIAFSLLFVSFKAFCLPSRSQLFQLAFGAFFYSFTASTSVICNLALVVAGMENCSGYLAIRKAVLLRRGSNSMDILLALPVNLGFHGIQALFNYRVVRAYDHELGRPGVSMALEGMVIAYLYSLLIVLDTITTCLFFKSCKSNSGINQAGRC